MPATAPFRSPAAAWRQLAPCSGRRGRALGFAGLALLVMLLHGALLHEPPGALGRPVRSAADTPQPVHMVLAAPPQPTATPATTTTPAADKPLATELPARPAPAPVSTPAAPAEPQPAVATSPAPAPTDAAARAVEPSAEAPAPPAAAPATVPPETPPVTPAPQPAPAAGTPPPVYPTEPPLNRTLDYRVVRGPASGLGQLRWEATPSAYTLSLQASVAGGPVLDWTSTGGFDSAGLAPQRMVERQREREVHAVNFQRDKQLISFSGSSRVEPLLRGAQDRLSWLIQLAAVVQAQRATLKEGDTLRFQVASPRGDVDEWVFTLMGIAPLEVAGMRWGALKLVREPQRPYDQRVEVWLAPVASYLPLALTLTTVPGGVPLELWLTGGLRIDL